MHTDFVDCEPPQSYGNRFSKSRRSSKRQRFCLLYQCLSVFISGSTAWFRLSFSKTGIEETSASASKKVATRSQPLKSPYLRSGERSSGRTRGGGALTKLVARR